MARTYAKLKGSIWRQEDWRGLPASHQRLYLLLFSQPEISNCGIVPYVPAKWARMAPDTTLEQITTIADDLQRAYFVVIDEDTCELLIRTYVKHDQVAEQPKIKAAAIRQYGQILSKRIRTALACEYPELFQLQPHEQADPEPYGKGNGKPNERLAEGYSVPTRARTQAASLQPYPPTAPAPVPPAETPEREPDDRGAGADQESRTGDPALGNLQPLGAIITSLIPKEARP